MTSPFNPQFSLKTTTTQHWSHLSGSSLSLAIAQTAKLAKSPLLIITQDILSSLRLEEELHFFLENENNPIPILLFPDWETLPYDHFSPHSDILSKRLTTLAQIPFLKQGIVITSITTLMHRLSPKNYLETTAFNFKIKDAFDLETIKLQLHNRGYYNVPQVLAHGEFSIRGSIFDLYPMGSEHPYRIDLFDNEVDSIRIFDPDTQRSASTINEIKLLPAREFPLDKNSISLFRQQWREKFPGNPLDCPIYQDISQGICPPGIEYYLTMFYQNTSNLIDYLSPQSLVVLVGDNTPASEQFWQEVNHRYTQIGIDRTRPLLAPTEVFLSPLEISQSLEKFAKIIIHTNEQSPRENQIIFNSQVPPNLAIDYKSSTPLAHLKTYLSSRKQRILFSAESAGRREALFDLLNKNNVRSKTYNYWNEFIEDDETSLGITVAPLSEGMVLDTPAISIITESQLFGQHVVQRRRRQKRIGERENVFRNLAELSVGSPVVHLEHGVGRYLGLQTITHGNQSTEFLMLEYGGGDKLYVPISSLHLISRYSGVDTEHAPLHRLGNNKWQKEKEKAAKQLRDVAAELLELYATRAASHGFQFKNPEKDYALFASQFPFEETPDQEQAILDVIADMTRSQPMDRLICGDVGFGKTEVAMRAAFLAVQNNKQVAILVPTTLLAEQHFHTFVDRFADWPVNIQVISRFRSQKEQKNIIEQLANNKIDIIIGTHKLLQSDIHFKELGLLIVDEEHRFGVQQKERLKKLRAEVDLMTLTATPIPRTLNMAVAGMRDLSIIATPPAKRLSIKTFVHERNDGLIREACLREIMRGGQVYFLHNKVETIERISRELEILIPEARIRVAHGQMRERELESIMADFYHQRFNILICTTIIENGIDIPSANTIIIDRADYFGLAQLHQLRGRVGRSHHQAYAYLLTPGKTLLTADAKKRLDAIAAYEDLGVGFTLSTHDLEIRGAGELLGEEQSGNIQAIGLTLYTELLERAVESLRNGQTFDFDLSNQAQTEIELPISALIPEDYLPDIHARLILYKRIANAKTETELDELQVEMIDRFGLLPEQTKNLFAITNLKLHAALIGIHKIEATAQSARIDFTAHTKVNPKIIIQLLQDPSRRYQMAGSSSLKFSWLPDEKKVKLEQLAELLATLS